MAMPIGTICETRIADTRWTAARLGRTLQRNISSGRLIVVSNREPCVHDVDPRGAIVATRPVSGAPSWRSRSGRWEPAKAGCRSRAS